MEGPRRLKSAFISGLWLIFGASICWAQSSGDPYCKVVARGTLANGDEFFGHATVNRDFGVSPPGIWRHFVPGSAHSPEAVFVGTIEEGVCIRDAGTFIQLFGAGRYAGRPVEFEIFGRDDATDNYLIMIRDMEANILYSALGDLASGDISVTFP